MRQHNHPVRLPLRLLCFLTLCLGALAGCDSGDNEETVAAVAGNYRGTVQDSVAGPGTVVVSIAQNGSSLTGTFQTTFQVAANNNSGSLTGTVSGSSVTLTVTPSRTTSCPFTVTATMVTATRLMGTYAAFNCTVAVSGTIDVTQQ